MRIVSLLPSATEIVYALGLGDELVGVTHECDYPPEAAGKPVMTRSVHDLASASSRDIHGLVSAAVHGGSSLYALDEVALAEAHPDLILTQELCRVCAVSYREVNDVARAIDADITVVSLEPTSIEGILNTITTVGAMTESEDTAIDLVESLRERLGRSSSSSRRAATAGSDRRGWSGSNGSIRRSPWATGSPSRSAAPAAGTSSARTASRRARPTGTRSARWIPRCSC